jgi:hypothetical protein
MTPIALSLIAFGCVAVGVLLGARGYSHLSEERRSSDTKEVVRLGMGLVGTTVALVLGLLIGSAKNFYDTQNSEMTDIAATAIFLDRVLIHYGPEAKGARDLLRSAVVTQLDRSQRKRNWDEPFFASGDPVFDKIQALSPQNDRQRSLQTQALGLMTIRPDLLVNGRAEDFFCSHAAAGNADLLAYIAFHQLWTLCSSQCSDRSQPDLICASGLWRNFPDPRNVSA